MAEHHYELKVVWTGNKGHGTKEYLSYERSHTISADGKPDILASSDPMFKGDSAKYNPEELLLAALSSCHMLTYLHLCTINKIVVESYEDKPRGTMVLKGNSGHFARVTLHPVVGISDLSKIEEAKKLHHDAHEICFIANSVNFPVEVEPEIIQRS